MRMKLLSRLVVPNCSTDGRHFAAGLNQLGPTRNSAHINSLRYRKVKKRRTKPIYTAEQLQKLTAFNAQHGILGPQRHITVGKIHSLKKNDGYRNGKIMLPTITMRVVSWDVRP